MARRGTAHRNDPLPTIWQRARAAALRKARRAAYGQATARLHQASSAAVSSVLKIMVDASAPASTRLRAADIVLAHTAKAIEIEDIEARVSEFESPARPPLAAEIATDIPS
jgi:hypothetical protein